MTFVGAELYYHIWGIDLIQIDNQDLIADTVPTQCPYI
jgi:hypothetical protein